MGLRGISRVKIAPAWLYQRYRSLFDRLVPALGMALLFMLAAQATSAFPMEWRLFIAGGVFVVGLTVPVAGYVLFILALAYPLYSISIYVAALALSLLILSAFFVTRHLAAVVLILATPLLSRIQIALAVPFLAGLWWAEWGGALVGLGSAFWLKLFAGMCGATLDLTRLGGQPLAAHRLIVRFRAANSLQTLLWLMEPFAPDPQTLLLHVLQMLGWGLAGYGVGLMRGRMSGLSRPAVGLFASVGAGFLGLGVGSIGVPMALGLLDKSALPLSFLIECCWSGAVAVGVYGISRYLARPAVALPSVPVGASGPAARPAPEPTVQPWMRPQSDDEEQADIIMIDLD